MVHSMQHACMCEPQGALCAADVAHDFQSLLVEASLSLGVARAQLPCTQRVPVRDLVCSVLMHA